MASVFDNTPCFYFSVRDDGTIMEANNTLCNKLGYNPQEIIDQKQDIIFPLATRIFHQTHLLPLLKIKGNANEIFISLQGKNKELFAVIFNIERKIKVDVAVTDYLGIHIEHRNEYENRLISDKKAAESALLENTALNAANEELNKRIEELDQQINLVKMQSAELKQFNKVMTHDLQEPLRKLSMFSHLLFYNKKEDIQKIVGKMVNASEKISNIVSSLQQYIWLSEAPLNHEKINLKEVIFFAEKKLEKEFPGVRLILKIEDLPSISADKKQMDLIIYHLLSNVIRFRKSGNEAYAKISGKLLQLNKFRNTKEKYKYYDFVKLQVKDEGVGFDPAYKHQVFELFKPLHNNSGLGAGLSLSKKIMDNHEGTISIDAAEGEGTTVTFIFPVH